MWEYDEFAQPVGVTFEGNGLCWSIPGHVPLPEMRQPLANAARELVNRKAREGWEPTEPIDPDRLWSSGRVIFDGGERGVVRRRCVWRVSQLRINFRRQQS